MNPGHDKLINQIASPSPAMPQFPLLRKGVAMTLEGLSTVHSGSSLFLYLLWVPTPPQSSHLCNGKQNDSSLT